MEPDALFVSWESFEAGLVRRVPTADEEDFIELEGTVYLGEHVSLYGNATFNSATYANHQWVANAPIGTGPSHTMPSRGSLPSSV